MIGGHLPATGATTVLDLVAGLDRDLRPREMARTSAAMPGWLERAD